MFIKIKKLYSALARYVRSATWRINCRGLSVHRDSLDPKQGYMRWLDKSFPSWKKLRNTPSFMRYNLLQSFFGKVESKDRCFQENVCIKRPRVTYNLYLKTLIQRHAMPFCSQNMKMVGLIDRTRWEIFMEEIPLSL